jgi:hypothetical protein
MSLRSCSLLACGLLTVALWLPAAKAQEVKVEKNVNYLNSSKNIRLSNGTVELIIPTDYGPRIMRYAFAGSGEDDNVFATLPGPTLKTDLGEWYIRGGHRLWHAPEGLPRSYEPDNGPIQVEMDGSTVKLIQPTEKTTQIQKEIWVTLDPQGTHVTVTHKLTNKGLFTVDMACWALSAMNKGGMGIFPQEPYKSHDEELQPARPMVLWAYTNLADPRWKWGKSLFTLQQDVNNKEAQKVGIQNRQGWAAFAHNGTLFVKRFPFDKTRTYPDFGCNNETFTNDAFLELETLGPMERVDPGQSITHTENWWLFKDVNLGRGEAGIASALAPIVAQVKQER